MIYYLIACFCTMQLMHFILISHSSIVGFNKMTPITAEKQILDKFYGRTKKFTNAVNEMKKTMLNMEKEKEKKRMQRDQEREKKQPTKTHAEQQKVVRGESYKIVLKRLTPKEIAKWSPKPPKSFGMVLRKR